MIIGSTMTPRLRHSSSPLLTVVALFLASAPNTLCAFHPAPTFSSRRRKESRLSRKFFSSIGGGNEPPSQPPSEGNNKGEWDDFLDPNREESENLQKAREYMSDNSLPISFDHHAAAASDKVEVEGVNGKSHREEDDEEEESPSSLVFIQGDVSEEILARNPYMAVVSRLSPSELISKFTATAHPRVQNAVRQTVLGLIGGLPKLAFDTTTITTGQRLASLMFQLQMTGYMLKNADYRLSLQQSLKIDNLMSNNQHLLTGTADDDDDDDDDTDSIDPLKGKVRGKLRIHYEGPSLSEDKDKAEEEKGRDHSESSSGGGSGVDLEVDAAAYMSELRSEVSKLREELTTTRKEKEEALRKDLLLYIRTLPEKELRSLTSTMSPDVLIAMKGLVNAVMTGIGEGQIGPDTVTEQSGEAMAQLCMWQLAIGYNLRTLEVREEMKKSLTGSVESDTGDGGVDHSHPGALE